MKTIQVARDFSRYPAGRFRKDGPYSGEAFRDRYLLPPLRQGEHLVVVLDGARGYGSSFLEEAFGGLIRNGISVRELRDGLLDIQCDDDPSLVIEAWSYIEGASSPARQ